MKVTNSYNNQSTLFRASLIVKDISKLLRSNEGIEINDKEYTYILNREDLEALSNLLGNLCNSVEIKTKERYLQKHQKPSEFKRYY